MVQNLKMYQGKPELEDHLNMISQFDDALKDLYVLPPEAQEEGVNKNTIQKFQTYDDVFNHYFKMFDEAFSSNYRDQ